MATAPKHFGTIATAQAQRKVTRDAFLYLDGTTRDNAQCSSCWLWHKDISRCGILGKDFTVHGEDSCGYWGPGPSLTSPPVKRFTPEQVGFVRREVRCENCRFFRDPSCHLYYQLNRTFPSQFRLDTKVEPRGCCNAQTPIED